MPPLLGLLSWLAIGLIAGVSAGRMLPGEPPLSRTRATGAGLGGALAGGLLATALGFGGLAAYDPRSLVTATLSAVLCLLLARHVTLGRATRPSG